MGKKNKKRERQENENKESGRSLSCNERVKRVHGDHQGRLRPTRTFPDSVTMGLGK